MADETTDENAHDARWWHAEDDHIVCDVCPRNCRLSDGQHGFCFVRRNHGGRLVLATYGKSTGFCIDPIEKKPLNHFIPGTACLSFGTAGCNLGCRFCQNWSISKAKSDEAFEDAATPEEVVRAALEMGCESIAFTYNDPVVWMEYAIDTAIAAREAGIKTVAVTAGFINADPRREFYKHFDAANVDLKAFTENFYRSLTLSHLAPVLETLEYLQHETDVWYEITNLIIPGKNDSEREIDEMCAWIADHLGLEVPLHFTAFSPNYRLTNVGKTPFETLARARKQALAHGLRFVYAGNVSNVETASTYCPSCNKAVIERDWHRLVRYELDGNRCKFCNELIPGVFASTPGTWHHGQTPVGITKERKEKLRQYFAAKAIPAEPNFTPRIDFSRAECGAIAQFTRAVIERAARGIKEPLPLPASVANAPAYGVFVSCKRGSMLRGCRGRWGNAEPQKLGEVLYGAAFETATQDPRFPSIAAEELPYLTIDTAIFHSARYLEAEGEERAHAFTAGTHGLAIFHPHGSGLLLPAVASERGLSNEAFLEEVCQKAGLQPRTWVDEKAQILIFETLVLRTAAMKNEVDWAMLPPPALKLTLDAANVVASGKADAVSLPPFMLQPFAGQFGLVLETAEGKASWAMAANIAPVELLKRLVKSLLPCPSFRRLSVVFQPIRIKPQEVPARLTLLPELAFCGQMGEQFTFSASIEEPLEKRLLRAILPLSNDPRDWASGKLVVTAFGLRTLALSGTATGPRIRPSAVSGNFYPADPSEMQRELEQHFAAVKGETPRQASAVYLPHAGWRFCGSLVAKTLAGTQIPKIAIIIGPRHTGKGASWSLAPQDFWAIPGALIPVNTVLGHKLLSAIPGLEVSPDAHAGEHCIEVLLPFLHHLRPDIEIVPIVVAATDYNATTRFAAGLVEVLKDLPEAPLLVLSGDMNHYANEAENRRRDQAALDAVSEAAPEKLFQVCQDEDISMCGLYPVITALQALKQLFEQIQVNVVGHTTSAEATGDTDRVVGYAGVRFSGYKKGSGTNSGYLN